MLSENTRGDLVDLADKLEERVVGKFLEGELALGGVAGVGLAENSVSVSGNDTTRVQGRPEVLLDILIRQIVADGLLHLGEPVKNFLVGQSMERTGKPVKTGSQGEHGRGEGGSDQVGGVGGDVTTLLQGKLAIASKGSALGGGGRTWSE